MPRTARPWYAADKRGYRRLCQRPPRHAPQGRRDPGERESWPPKKLRQILKGSKNDGPPPSA